MGFLCFEVCSQRNCTPDSDGGGDVGEVGEPEEIGADEFGPGEAREAEEGEFEDAGEEGPAEPAGVRFPVGGGEGEDERGEGFEALAAEAVAAKAPEDEEGERGGEDEVEEFGGEGAASAPKGERDAQAEDGAELAPETAAGVHGPAGAAADPVVEPIKRLAGKPPVAGEEGVGGVGDAGGEPRGEGRGGLESMSVAEHVAEHGVGVTDPGLVEPPRGEQGEDGEGA